MSVAVYVIWSKVTTTFPGYKVHKSNTLETTDLLIRNHFKGWFDAAIVIHSHPCDEAFIQSVQLFKRHVPTMFLNHCKDDTTTVQCDALIPFGTPVMEWLERLRVITARRRGPKKEGYALEQEAAA